MVAGASWVETKPQEKRLREKRRGARAFHACAHGRHLRIWAGRRGRDLLGKYQQEGDHEVCHAHARSVLPDLHPSRRWPGGDGRVRGIIKTRRSVAFGVFLAEEQ